VVISPDTEFRASKSFSCAYAIKKKRGIEAMADPFTPHESRLVDIRSAIDEADTQIAAGQGVEVNSVAGLKEALAQRAELQSVQGALIEGERSGDSGLFDT
jgi:hypothetical protein